MKIPHFDCWPKVSLHMAPQIPVNTKSGDSILPHATIEFPDIHDVELPQFDLQIAQPSLQGPIG